MRPADGTLIRHLRLSADQVGLLSGRVMGPSTRRLLVAPPRPSTGLPTRLSGASAEAVDIAPVAGAAELDEGPASGAAVQAMVGRSALGPRRLACSG